VDRTPPIEVRRSLRREVGFGCPVDGCGNPYLYWHHFDPPWRERQHHDQRGMIALCAEHHAKADAGAFTKDQLHALKVNMGQALEISGRFDWMRQRLLAVVGGNFYFDTPIPVQIHGVQVVAFSRDEAEHWLLNVAMPSGPAEPRMTIAENFWLSRGEPQDVECPPHGRLLAAKYANGDAIRVEFIPDLDADGLGNRYADVDPTRWGLPTPIAVVEIEMSLVDAGIEFGPRSTRIGGSMMTNCFIGNCAVGLHIGP
jgi:hypothetical protein